MTNYRFGFLLLATMGAMLFYSGARATGAPKDRAMQAGKKGEVRLDTEVRIGDMTLLPGRYTFQRRMERSNHFVRFTELTKSSAPGTKHNPNQMKSGTQGADAIEVRCIRVPLGEKVSETRIYYSDDADGTPRLIRLEVAGENATHFFPMGMTNLLH
jgi:hypothetical protein